VEIESPCINLCFLEDGLCQGCFRTEDEIVSWMLMTDQERRSVMKRLRERIDKERYS
jgi:hypothetical protein